MIYISFIIEYDFFFKLLFQYNSKINMMLIFIFNTLCYSTCTDWIFRPPTCEQLMIAQLAQHNVFFREWILQERTFRQIKYGS